MEKEDVDHLIEKKPFLEGERLGLERLHSGTYCLHRTFGMGQIVGYDSGENKLVIDFDEAGQRRMDPEFCLRKLNVLSDEDMLVKFRKSPDEIRQRLNKSAVSVLMEYLEQMPSHRASLGDIEGTFSKIVDEKNFKKWWNSTKKLVAKEPKLALDEGNVTYLRICEEPISKEEVLMDKMKMARELADKIAIGEKCLAAVKSDPALMDFGISVVELLNNAISSKTKKTTVADCFQACVIRDELAKLVGINADSLQPKIESIVSGCQNLPKVCNGLGHNYYRVFLELVTRVFPDEWEKICFNILRNCGDRLTNECITYLYDNGCAENIRTTFVKWLKEKNLRSALLQWIIKNRHAKKFEEVFSADLMSPELLRVIFLSIDNEALQSSGRARKIRLAELLVNDRSLIHDLLKDSDDEVAGDLAQTLLVNQGIDSLTKKSLLARFITMFPSVQELVLSTAKASLPQEVSLKVSLASLEEKRKEYDILVKEKIPANKKAIEIAREHGDLSENSEYKMARQDQDTLLSRKTQLENELKMAEVIDLSSVDVSMVSIGSVVTARKDGSGESSDFTILGAWDSDPARNIISYKTAMAQALLGKKVGDVVEIESGNTTETWKVESIRAYDS